MAVSENGNAPQLFYTYTDHLGSITAVTNAQGNVIARQNFDAWGRRRNALDYSYLPQHTTNIDNGISASGNLPQWLYRGYTGHEMLDEFALINMNARLYDPVLGMMLSPDNYIQDPSFTQNYNRYGYCFNNPLRYTDPSGNISQEGWRQLGYMALGAAFGVASWSPLLQHYKGNITWGQAAGLYAVNAVAFVAGAGVGGAVTSGAGTIAGATIGGATSGAISGGGGYLVSHTQGGTFYGNGNDLWRATWTGSVSGAAGGAVNASIGGGLGAFAGGFTSSALGSYLKDGNIDYQGALLSGSISLGVYSANVYANWYFTNGNIGGRNYNFGSYYRMQGALQRYQAYGKRFEIGANVYASKNGNYKFGRIRYGSLIGDPTVSLPNKANAVGDIHSHTVRGVGGYGHGPTDIGNLYYEKHSDDYFSDVLGYNGCVYSTTKGQVMGLGKDINQLGLMNGKTFVINPSLNESSYGNFMYNHSIINQDASYSIGAFFYYFIFK
jgi:RHS repeat-associated protein